MLRVSRFIGGVYLFCLFVFLSPGLEIVVGLRIVGVYSATSHGTARQLDRPECDSQEYACSGSLLQTCKKLKTKNTCILWSQNHKMSLQKLGRCQESFVNRISLISGPTFGSGGNQPGYRINLSCKFPPFNVQWTVCPLLGSLVHGQPGEMLIRKLKVCRFLQLDNNAVSRHTRRLQRPVWNRMEI